MDDLIQYHNNSSNGNDWCQSCVLLFSDCICSAGTPAGSYDYSSWSSTLAIQTSNHTSNVYQQLHSNPNYNTTSLCIPSQTWASTALASRESSAAIGNRSEGSKVKRGRVKGTLSIEEARVVCLPCSFGILELNKSPETIRTKSEITARFSISPSQNNARFKAESGSPNRGE